MYFRTYKFSVQNNKLCLTCFFLYCKYSVTWLTILNIISSLSPFAEWFMYDNANIVYVKSLNAGHNMSPTLLRTPWSNSAHTWIYTVKLKQPNEGTRRKTELCGVGLAIRNILNVYKPLQICTGIYICRHCWCVDITLILQHIQAWKRMWRLGSIVGNKWIFSSDHKL